MNENVAVFSHPLIKHKISQLRDETCKTKEFRALVEEISMLMGYEVLRDLEMEEIEIKTPESILATNTITSMQAGLMYGVIGETKYIIEQMKKETGFKDMKVVATGGLGKMISREVPEINCFDDTLTLKGLRIIYEKQL